MKEGGEIILSSFLLHSILWTKGLMVSVLGVKVVASADMGPVRGPG